MTHMVKPKELVKDLFISATAGGAKQWPTPGTKDPTYNKKKAIKYFHPPIEAHWQLPPLRDMRNPNYSFKAMLSNPVKYSKSFRRSQSTEQVDEGSRNHEKLVDSFREMLFLEGHLPGNKHFDYHTLMRFLRMKDFDLAKAKDAFMLYIRWREEFSVDSISKGFIYDEHQEVKICYPHGFHGVDRYGRPVYIERVGMVDLDTFLQVTTIDRFLKHHIQEQERTLNWRYPACSLAAKKHIASTVSILDVKGVGMSSFSKTARYIFMEIQKIDSNYYPETLHQLFIINAGSGFRVLWKAVKAFLDARTLAKIRVLGTDYESILVEAIDPSNLPGFLGGECTCPESGGCLYSDKGPWNDPEITEMLQGMLYNEDENNSNKLIACNSEEDADETLLRKVKAFETVLEDAKEKIGMLETAMEDTKVVLQGLAQHIEDMKILI